LSELVIQLANHGLEALCRSHRILAINELRDSIEKSSECDFGEEIPEIIATDRFFVFGLKSPWKTDALFELYDAGVRKIHFSE
jgi:hypothetical protein